MCCREPCHIDNVNLLPGQSLDQAQASEPCFLDIMIYFSEYRSSIGLCHRLCSQRVPLRLSSIHGFSWIPALRPIGHASRRRGKKALAKLASFSRRALALLRLFTNRHPELLLQTLSSGRHTYPSFRHQIAVRRPFFDCLMKYAYKSTATFYPVLMLSIESV